MKKAAGKKEEPVIDTVPMTLDLPAPPDKNDIPKKKMSYSAMIREALTKDPNLNQTALAKELGCTAGQISAVKKSMTPLSAVAPKEPKAAKTSPNAVVDALDLASELIKSTGSISSAIAVLKKLEEMKR